MLTEHHCSEWGPLGGEVGEGWNVLIVLSEMASRRGQAVVSVSTLQVSVSLSLKAVKPTLFTE